VTAMRSAGGGGSAMPLRAHANVIPIAEERERRRAVRFQFVNWQAEPSPPSHPAAQALLAGLMQGIGERERDQAMVDAGRQLAEAETRGLPSPCPPSWWRRWLRLRPIS
jgi:hypothetical protein